MFVIVYRYEVIPQHVAAFRAAYGAKGAWAAFFGADPAFVRTDLLEGKNGEFLSLDYWRTETAYDAFLKSKRRDYQALDKTFARFKRSEMLIGRFAGQSNDT